MLKVNKHIVLVRSAVVSLSSMSQQSCDAARAVLGKHYSRVSIFQVNHVEDLERLVAIEPDLVFLGMEFIPLNLELGRLDPDKIWLSTFLDEQDIAYTGSNQSAHELGRNKALAKQHVLSAGLNTAKFCIAKQDEPLHGQYQELSFPLFVKPTDRGGGLGINSDSVVHSSEQLHLKVESIAGNLQSDSLIEEYLPGREFSVAILKNEHDDGFNAMPIELIAPADKQGQRLLSGKVKASNTEQAMGLDDSLLSASVTRLALEVFKSLGARDYGRVDIRLDEAGQPSFLEVNLIPSLISGYGSFPKACLINIGMDYEPMILGIAKLGLARGVEREVTIPALNALGLPVPGAV